MSGEVVAAFAAIVGTLWIGSMSPGPSFVLVAQTSVSTSRKAGIAVAAGMGFGALVFAALALAGLHGLLAAVPVLYLALKALGGLYLAYLAVRIWRNADAGIVSSGPNESSPRLAIRRGFMTQIANPKTAIVYASTFAAFLPETGPRLAYAAALIPIVFCIEFGWYTIVATALSSRHPRQLYLKAKRAIDRLTATVLGVLGTKLILDARSPA